MVNTYPFMSYANDLANVPLENAFFDAGAAPVRDGALAYTNLFDSLVAALEKEGFGGMPVAATETRPPRGTQPRPHRTARGVGTPRRPGVTVVVFLFDMYDEDGKPSAEFERHFGIFRADGSKA